MGPPFAVAKSTDWLTSGICKANFAHMHVCHAVRQPIPANHLENLILYFYDISSDEYLVCLLFLSIR